MNDNVIEIKKVVKVPIVIDEDNEDLRKLKYKIIYDLMREAQYLGNMALRYLIAYNLKKIPRECDSDGKQVPLDTLIYRILAKERKYLPAIIVASIGHQYAAKLYRQNNKPAWRGEKSLPTFHNLFLPIVNQRMVIKEITKDKGKQFHIQPSGLKEFVSDEVIREKSKIDPLIIVSEKREISFKSCFSWKDTGSVAIVSRIVSGEYKLCDSEIKESKKGLMLFLSFKFNSVPLSLDPNKVCGVDMGIAIPAVCAVNFGLQRRFIGYKSDIDAARWKFRAIRRRKQRRRGLVSKSIQWECSDKEKNWVQTYYHNLTRQIIDFCIKNGCGTIIVEDLSDLRKSDCESEYKRLMWTPCLFQSKLEYKAKDVGIVFVKMNPKNTSRRCWKCGCISKENRINQDRFKCIKCGNEEKADYNAAKNISMATEDVREIGYVDRETKEIDKNTNQEDEHLEKDNAKEAVEVNNERSQRRSEKAVDTVIAVCLKTERTESKASSEERACVTTVQQNPVDDERISPNTTTI